MTYSVGGPGSSECHFWVIFVAVMATLIYSESSMTKRLRNLARIQHEFGTRNSQNAFIFATCRCTVRGINDIVNPIDSGMALFQNFAISKSTNLARNRRAVVTNTHQFVRKIAIFQKFFKFYDFFPILDRFLKLIHTVKITGRSK